MLRGNVTWSGGSVVRGFGRSEQVASSALLHREEDADGMGGLAGRRVPRLLDQLHEARRVVREPARMAGVLERDYR